MMSILSREFMIYAQGGHEFPALTEVETVEHFGFSADTIWTSASARIYRRKCLRDQLIWIPPLRYSGATEAQSPMRWFGAVMAPPSP